MRVKVFCFCGSAYFANLCLCYSANTPPPTHSTHTTTLCLHSIELSHHTRSTIIMVTIMHSFCCDFILPPPPRLPPIPRKDYIIHCCIILALLLVLSLIVTPRDSFASPALPSAKFLFLLCSRVPCTYHRIPLIRDPLLL